MAQRDHGCGLLLLTTRCQNRDKSEWAKQFPEEPGILLAQRGFRARAFPGHFGGPGGLRKPREKPHNAARRETREELGIRRIVVDPKPFYQGSWQDRDLSYFLADWWAPDMLIIDPKEVHGYGIYAIQDALNQNLSFAYRAAIVKLRREGLL